MQVNKAAAGAEVCSPSTRCRYKTGRCPNPRAVKANGTLLLLCEYHRNQQNRTKKRSDMKCRHDRAKKRQAQREKLQKKQLPVGPVGHVRNTLCWSPLASIIAPSVDDYAMTIGSPSTGRDQEKTLESTSPTAVDLDVASMNWAPQCMSPIATPPICVQEDSLAAEDIWLLEYFIL
ncbi:hypothetical protein F441_13531 [Phytophthora nicotianae CJ01A1]|uniref:Uncharacterized protein n=6 Tax=Phytophthora nicotianae TaxID=4792 RepID=W2R596_PHYN3|nr:hypothetical protein PPTG_03556 [Phytophthora nicotianae INRA-310]ETI41163.1 hypothetical protein F443_13599 [Phytophthora nicotianae P1569]ETK81226.1 hypothetical protein L915_13273 [Phytophthora nicotianae]ETO69832.1 hypothetical protein F444_13652 [Phytophthora nicotianae P1976]ETP10932.1 hypothetical protein F441_13531 [Phytophthora nicotianae CJ01A1]ETP39070.1 hypothetical protein F442_13457 [Phytophthora nicotianae P10297]KUF76261.1 hypothetical protein AM587_10011481 [Phytophthora n